MIFRLFLLFTIIPFIELALLIKIGSIIGIIETLIIIILTGLIGAIMVRAAGVQCVFRIRENLQSGMFPADDLFSGLLILISGAFLVTPGLLTDAAGFILLFSPTREIIKQYLMRYLKSKFDEGNLNIRIT
jgi:UPF0716 protein FxsA